MGELAARGGWKSLTRGGVWPWVDVFPSIFYWFSAFFYVILCVSIDKHVLCMSYACLMHVLCMSASSMHVLCRHCELNPMSSLDALGKPGPSRSHFLCQGPHRAKPTRDRSYWLSASGPEAKLWNTREKIRCFPSHTTSHVCTCTLEKILVSICRIHFAPVFQMPNLAAHSAFSVLMWK